LMRIPDYQQSWGELCRVASTATKQVELTVSKR